MRKITNNILIILAVLVMCLGVGYLVFAWTPPTVAPPGGNVPAPLNVSTTTQEKPGILRFTRFEDVATTSWFVAPGVAAPGVSAAYRGRVGIGTTGPGARLQVQGVGTTTAATFNVTDSAGTSRLFVRDDGRVGIGTTDPHVKLDVAGAFAARGMAAPATSPAGQGRIYFDSTTNTFRVSQNAGAFVNLGLERACVIPTLNPNFRCAGGITFVRSGTTWCEWSCSRPEVWDREFAIWRRATRTWANLRSFAFCAYTGAFRLTAITGTASAIGGIVSDEPCHGRSEEALREVVDSIQFIAIR